MAAPSNTTWGALDGNSKGRLGIYVTTSSTNTQMTVNIQVWFWSKYSVHDSVNTFSYNGTSLGSVSIYTTSDSGGWSTDNQQLIHSAQHTYNRGSSAYSVSFSASLATIEVLSGTISVSTSVSVPVAVIWNDINALNPSGVQDNASAWFNLSYSDGCSYSNLTNETDATKPYGTVMTISNIRPYHSYYELDYVSGATHNGSGVYTNTMTTQNHIVEIKMKYKTYTLTINPNGGSFNGGGTSPINMSPLLQYNSSNWCDVSSYIPTRPGYEFLGFYDANGTIVYDSNGAAYSTAHWSYNGTTHVYVYEGNLTVYAQWKPANIAYYNKNGNWLLCNSYVKNNGTWKPAIMKNIDKE